MTVGRLPWDKHDDLGGEQTAQTCAMACSQQLTSGLPVNRPESETSQSRSWGAKAFCR